jgi:hypothetical protein
MLRTIAAASLIALSSFPASSTEYAEFFKSFAPEHCCWTNQCCFEVPASTVVGAGRVDHNGNPVYRVIPTGEVIARHGPSPNSRYYRCACDQDGSGYKFTPTSRTRCLFTPDEAM